MANSAADVFLPVPYALVNPACDFGLFPGAPRGLAPQLAWTTKTLPTHTLLLRPGTSNFLDLQNSSSFHCQTVPSVPWNISYPSTWEKNPPLQLSFFPEHFWKNAL